MMNYHSDEEEDGYAGDEPYEECEVCHQEFHGVCPINSADCPYAEDDDELDDLDDEENLDDLIGDDEEIEKIIEDEAGIPVEDLVDEERGEAEEEKDVTPSKTVEELEAEALELAKQKKKGKAKPAAGKVPAKKTAPAKKVAAKKTKPKPAPRKKK